MRYFLSFIIILVFSMVSLYGQKAPAKTVMTKDSPVGSDISETVVQAFCDQIVKELEGTQNDFKKQSYQNYTIYSHQLNKWMNYQFLELDSDIDRSWFNKIQEFFVFFHKTKRTYDRSLEADTSKAKTLSKKDFEVGVASFKKFLKLKPPKANPQRVAYLNREKKKYLEEKRAKERAKERASGNKTSLYD